jgi:hypothetical protein
MSTTTQNPQVMTQKPKRGRPAKQQHHVAMIPSQPIDIKIQRGSELSFSESLFIPMKIGNELDTIFSTEGGLMPGVNMVMAGGAGSGGTGSGGTGAGGIGSQSSITGAATFYAGGGGGASNGSAPAGGTGGGGAGGGRSPNTAGIIGSINTGGGGGGANSNFSTDGANGGSGVVIIAYPDTYTAPVSISGGLVYDQPARSGYRVYRFTSGTGTITW